MIARIEALNYRCFQHVAQELRPFNVLVGPNASGKSTFLDVLRLLQDFLNTGLEHAVLIGADPHRPRGRARRIEELFFQGRGDRFELAVELDLPRRFLESEAPDACHRARYEVAFGRAESGELSVWAENFVLKTLTPELGADGGRAQGPWETPTGRTILSAWTKHPAPPMVTWTGPGGPRPQTFESEMQEWFGKFKLKPGKSALASLPEDTEKFPIALWVRNVLQGGVHSLALDVEALRRPCSPTLPTTLLSDGSNLPRVVQKLRQDHPDRFKDWIAHVQTVLPDLKTIDVIEQEHDRHTYLRLHHTSGDPVPAWLISDGTLRMLALTILPYILVRDSIYLIEEPENGVHPQAIESVLDALSSVYDNQVLLATHSPMLMSRAELKDLLCFRRGEDGAAEVIRGDRHPYLADWKGEVSLSTLYASGVLS